MSALILNDSYGHGGDVYKNRVRLDFSANVNPLGTPPQVRRAAARAAAELAAYPDPYCGRLRAGLAAALGTDARYILCGNGAAELIFQFALALRPRRAVLPVPAFSEYEAALTAAGCRPAFYPLRREDGFVLPEAILESVTADTDLVMLCSPNNPTGRCVPPALLDRLLARCRETGAWLFLDECFWELTDPDKAYTLVPELRENDRVLVLRAFTKLYGMAGARLGYAVCKNGDMLERMCRLVQPWNVSAPAQAAGEAALACAGWAERTEKLLCREKRYLLRELRALGLTVLPGDANFLMLSGVPELYDRLLERQILIRRCGNYRGLDAGDCRIAVRTHAENAELIAALRELRHA